MTSHWVIDMPYGFSTDIPADERWKITDALSMEKDAVAVKALDGHKELIPVAKVVRMWEVPE